MTGINGHFRVTGQPVGHHGRTAAVVVDIGRRQPVDERRSVAALVDEVAGKQSLPRRIVDGHAALRVTRNVHDLQSVGNVEYLQPNKRSQMVSLCLKPL